MNLRYFFKHHTLKLLLAIAVLQLVVIALLENVNKPPLAKDDDYICVEDRLIKIRPLDNDSDDVLISKLTLINYEEPHFGRVEQSRNTLIYTPKKGFIGKDSILYRISDGEEESEPAVIVIDVQKNKPPVINHDHVMVYQGEQVVLNVLGNDYDREGDTIQLLRHTLTTKGNLIRDDNQFVYTATHAVGLDSFTYQAIAGDDTTQFQKVLIRVLSKKENNYPWLSIDIGDTKLKGSTHQTKNTYTLKASGTDLWSSNDGYHYHFKRAKENCEVRVKITSLKAAHKNGKAGLMIRADQSSGSPYFSVGMTFENGLYVQSRNETNDQTIWHYGDVHQTFPVWLKIIRWGDVFTALISEDGKDWEQVARINSLFPADALVGLAFCNHSNEGLGEVVFEDFEVAE